MEVYIIKYEELTSPAGLEAACAPPLATVQLVSICVLRSDVP